MFASLILTIIIIFISQMWKQENKTIKYLTKLWGDRNSVLIQAI